VAESETLASPMWSTADFAYHRFRKASYSADERKAMLETLRGHTGQGRDVFAYFKHEETRKAVLYARDCNRGEIEPTYFSLCADNA